MRFLLDENMSARTAMAMTGLAADDGDEYRYLGDFGAAGMADLEIPRLCRREGFDCLITVNHRDFAAQKVVYQALLADQVHVVVLRFGKRGPNPDLQVGYLAVHRATIRTMLAETADRTMLLVVRQSSVKGRDLDELEQEILADPKLPLP